MEKMNGNKSKKWNLLYPVKDGKLDAAVREMAAQIGLSPIIGKLLYNRGYKTAAQAISFLNCDSALLHDPYLMKDMEKAVERVKSALEKKERIAIYGDYDVDGVTSVSLLYLYLSSLGADVGYYIPSRIGEGYGLSRGAIDKLHDRQVDLIITVDTGITANEETDYASSIGIDMVITDHHECREELPRACAVVNPHRPDCTYPFCELAGVGVVFKFVCAYEMMLTRARGGQDIDAVRKICYGYADLVAIGTIADVMPIADENRLIVTLGLNMITQTGRKGVSALIEASSGPNGKQKKITSGFIGYTIAPRINAAGRISSATKAVELLLADSDEKAAELAAELCEINQRRQVEENRIAEQVYKKIDSDHDFANDRIIVIDDDDWQQGIIGIVASRITERYGVPSILISYDGSTRGFVGPDDIGKGSGRSVKGMNLVEALNSCEDLLVKHGGHELAAGLTIRRGQIGEFRRRINEYAREKLGGEEITVSLDAECEIEMEELTMALALEIFRLEPFGVANPVPNFVLRDAKITKVIPMGSGKHTKFIVEKNGISMSAVWFGMPSARLSFQPTDRVDILFQLNINEYQHFKSLQMIVQDMKTSDAFLDAQSRDKRRYEEIKAGAEYDESDNVLPCREDFALVYSLLRRESRVGHTAFDDNTLLNMLEPLGANVSYVKLKYIIRILQELNICGVSEPEEGKYLFDIRFNPAKTNIEKSAILKKLRSQCRVRS